jgi:hypothetical protein
MNEALSPNGLKHSLAQKALPAGYWKLTPILLATQEEEIGRIKVRN